MERVLYFLFWIGPDRKPDRLAGKKEIIILKSIK